MKDRKPKFNVKFPNAANIQLDVIDEKWGFRFENKGIYKFITLDEIQNPKQNKNIVSEMEFVKIKNLIKWLDDEYSYLSLN